VFIGGAMYPTLALLNHSCNPSVMRYFAPGGVVVVRTVRSLQPGEEVSETYGPLWTREERDARRQRLRGQYWFDCGCEACDADWPLYQDIPEDAIRLRCGACSAAIKFGEEQITATCLVCGHKTSVLASLAGVADTERKMEVSSCKLKLYFIGCFRFKFILTLHIISCVFLCVWRLLSKVCLSDGKVEGYRHTR